MYNIKTAPIIEERERKAKRAYFHGSTSDIFNNISSNIGFEKGEGLFAKSFAMKI
jgi:hypothetical protein